MRILVTITARYPPISMMIKMTIQSPMTSFYGDYPGKQWAIGHQQIPSRQYIETESWQLHHLLGEHSQFHRSVRRSIWSSRRRMNGILRCRHPRRYSIERLNNCIRSLMCIFTRGRIQTKLVSDWLHGKLEICGDMSPSLTTWQASFSAEIETPRHLF